MKNSTPFALAKTSQLIGGQASRLPRRAPACPRGSDPDQGDDDGHGARRGEPPAQLVGLLARAGDQDAQTVQGPTEPPARASRRLAAEAISSAAPFAQRPAAASSATSAAWSSPSSSTSTDRLPSRAETLPCRRRRPTRSSARMPRRAPSSRRRGRAGNRAPRPSPRAGRVRRSPRARPASPGPRSGTARRLPPARGPGGSREISSHCGDLPCQPEPQDARAGKERRIVFPGLHFPDPGLHVPPDGTDDEVRPQGEELGLAPRAAGPDHRAAGQRGKARVLPAR